MTKKPETELLLLEIGTEMGRTEEQMRPLITKLVEENWLETKESLAALTADQWKHLALPLRLEAALKCRLGLTESSASPGTAEGSANPQTRISPDRPGTPQTDSPSTEQQQQQQQQQHGVSGDEFTADNSSPPESLFVCTLENALDKLQLEVDGEALKEAVRVLQQLLLGVLEQPENPKKRKVRLENPTFSAKVGRHAAAVRVLLSVGFVQETIEGAKCLVLRVAYLRRLVICYRLLTEIASALGVPVSPLPRGYFDPFASSITSNSGQSTLPKPAAEARAAEAREIERQIKERERLLATGGSAPPPLDPQVFTLEQMRCLDRQQREQQQQQQEYWEDGPVPANALTAADIMRIKDVMGDGPAFQSRAKQQLQQLQKRAVFKHCCVRLLLPDGLVLQLFFAPSDCLGHVQTTAAQFLHEDFRTGRLKWFLCETPPLRRMAARRTLYEEGLAPRCILHVKLEDDSPEAPLCCLDSNALSTHGVSIPSPSSSSSSSSSSSRANPSASHAHTPQQLSSPSSFSNSNSSSSSSSKSRRTLSRLLGSRNKK